MYFIKKNRKLILFISLYIALFLLGFNIYEVLNNGINDEKNVLLQLSGIISTFFLSFGLYWELYSVKRNKN